MKIIKIEPTPSPNTLKITLDFKKSDLKSSTYSKIEKNNPEFINLLLANDQIKSVFHVLDFISIDKQPSADWETILPEIHRIFNHESQNAPINIEPDSGEKKTEVLFFKNIPYQIKITHSSGEARKQLDVRFIDAMLAAQNDHDNVILLRKWKDIGNRYGDINEIFESVKEEMDALYPDEVLQKLIIEAREIEHVELRKELKRVSIDEFIKEKDWKIRYRMIDHFPKPTIDDIPFFETVLNDEKPQIRRLAVVFLGMIENKAVLEPLHQAVFDSNITVRRTAGDTLSDLGFIESLPIMHQLLDDKHAIVRWRAAMFIYDEGNTSSIPVLEKHLNDDAFDVKLQVQMAYERIKNGEQAVGSVWKQIANRNNKD